MREKKQMKKTLLLLGFLVAPALLLAQGAAPQSPQGPRYVPGQPEWKGDTVQIGQPHPTPDVGGLDPAEMTKPLAGQWTSYSGDLSGKRFSSLKLIVGPKCVPVALSNGSVRRRPTSGPSPASQYCEPTWVMSGLVPGRGW